MTDIRRLAIVNRGEPAMRALTAVAELNASGDWPPITTVVLYTEPDAGAWYVRDADEAIPLGPATYRSLSRSCPRPPPARRSRARSG